MHTKAPLTFKTFVSIVLCLVIFSSAGAQQKNVLEYKKGSSLFSMKRYYLNGEKMSNKKIGELLEKENKEAYKVFRGAMTLKTVGLLVSITSAILFIEESMRLLGALINNTFDSKSKALWVISVGGIICGSILGIASHSEFKRAITLYNNGVASTGKIQVNFGVTPSGGIGFTASF